MYAYCNDVQCRTNVHIVHDLRLQLQLQTEMSTVITVATSIYWWNCCILDEKLVNTIEAIVFKLVTSHLFELPQTAMLPFAIMHCHTLSK